MHIWHIEPLLAAVKSVPVGHQTGTHERPSVPLSGQNIARAHERTNLPIRREAFPSKRLLPHIRNMSMQEAAAEKNCSDEPQSIEEQHLQTPAKTASMSSAAAEQEQQLLQAPQDQEGAAAQGPAAAAENAPINNASAPAKAASNSKNRYQAAAAAAAANELLRLLGDTSKQLSCIQGHHDGGTFLLFDGGKVELAQILQLQNPGLASSSTRIAPGHEKDAVCVEDICTAVRTYAMQVTNLC